MGEMIKAGDVGVWVERRGQGPDVLLIAGLGDPAEAWEPQLDGLADRWSLTALALAGGGRPERARRPPQLSVPTLVLAGELDIATPPRLGRVVAEHIPAARFAVLPGAAHQPFQETPAEFNDRVDAFWRQVQARETDAHPRGWGGPVYSGGSPVARSRRAEASSEAATST